MHLDTGVRHEQPDAHSGDRVVDRPAPVPIAEIFWYFLKLGWLAFGGPVGQIGLMHLEVVERRRWLTEEEFVRALNFVHVLPGPEALQLTIYIGWRMPVTSAAHWRASLPLPGIRDAHGSGGSTSTSGSAARCSGCCGGSVRWGSRCSPPRSCESPGPRFKGPSRWRWRPSHSSRSPRKLPFLVVLLGCGVVYLAGVPWRPVQRRRAPRP